MALQLTIVRVFPTCQVLGKVHVRGRSGVNRVPFRGRLHGRRLPNGTYRLLIGARRAQPTAEATVVIAHGKISAARLRKARQANACVPPIGFSAATPAAFAASGRATGGDDGNPVVSVAKGVVKKAKSLTHRAKEAIEDPAPIGTGLLVLVGLLMLTIAGFGALFVVNAYRWRERLLR